MLFAAYIFSDILYLNAQSITYYFIFYAVIHNSMNIICYVYIFSPFKFLIELKNFGLLYCWS